MFWEVIFICQQRRSNKIKESNTEYPLSTFFICHLVEGVRRGKRKKRKKKKERRKKGERKKERRKRKKEKKKKKKKERGLLPIQFEEEQWYYLSFPHILINKFEGAGGRGKEKGKG